jgi:ABC-2 type transport system permease protein
VRSLIAILKRELRAYFFAPLAYVVAALLLLVNGAVFWLIVSYLNDPRAGIGAPLELFFGQTVFFWLVLLFVAPVVTMRLLSEERRSGTIEVLMTAPVTETMVVVGKYLAALIFYLFLWLPTVVYGPVAAGYVGIVGIGALLLAAGVLASALSRSQLVAAVLTFAIAGPLFAVGFLEFLFTGDLLKEVFAYLSLPRHMEDFSRGIVDSRRLVYYVSVSALFLFLAARALAVKKWR